MRHSPSLNVTFADRGPINSIVANPSSVRCSDQLESIDAAVGNTPLLLIPAGAPGERRGYWAKLEGANPGGIKDRTALYMVQRARERGELRAGATIVESTSGTLGLGLALAGITYGHPVTVVTDPGMEPMMQQMLRAYGTELELVEEPDPVGGWQEARRQRVREIVSRHPDSYCPDQYHNPDNVTAYGALAHELLNQLEHIDTLVCSVGTGGHSAGVTRVLRQVLPELRLVGVDTINSTIFGQPPGPRLMRGLGSSIYPRNVDYTAFDEVHWVAPAEAVWTCRELAARSYATGGWSVGAVGLVANWVARTSPARARIAAIFPDGPQRYFDTVYNDDFCREHDLLERPPADHPDSLRHSNDGVVRRWTRCVNVVAPRSANQHGDIAGSS